MKREHSKLHQWQERIKDEGTTCRCGRRYQLTVDHIIPVSLLIQLGLKEVGYDDEENFDIICRFCNTQKAGGLDHNNPKTLPLLKKYLALYERNLSL